MIECVRGVVLEKEPTFCIVDVQGVGYGLNLSVRTGELVEKGKEILLYTYLAVKEDSLTLFGFKDTNEKKLFTTLIEVNGIGPKMAQRILSEASPEELASWVLQENIVQITKLKGIGKKTAELLVVQLKGKVAKLNLSSATEVRPSNQAEAIQALVSLGLKEAQAAKAVEKAVKLVGGDSDVAALITEALRFA